MADVEAKDELLKNLPLLLDMEILKDERDWKVIKAMAKTKMLHKVDKLKQGNANEK